jgi:hypothetical protein
MSETANKIEQCETCKFWMSLSDDRGLCQRYPPSCEKDANDWCGEWRSKQARTVPHRTVRTETDE